MDLLKRRLMMLPKDEPYIQFADPVVAEICATLGDGVGLTKRMARKVTTAQFKAAFNASPDRTSITSFDEFRYFVHVTETGDWSGCTALTSITLPKRCQFADWYAFKGCSSLASINIGNLSKMRGQAFNNCSSLRIEVDMPGLMNYNNSTGLGYEGFRGSGITKVLNLGTVRDIGEYSFFQGCQNLTEIWLPKTIEKIGRLSMYQCNALVTLVVLATTPPVVIDGSLRTIGGAQGRKIYVPYSEDHSVLNAYKSSEYWTIYSADIYELNPDGTVPDE